jgi:DNA polymerase-3 subunit gamma/tau
MSKNTLYLKYRPKQLSDLIGQDNFVQTLKQASKFDRYAHAYLLSGTKGCGKTSSSRIIANLLNCDDVQEGEVCGKCQACKTIPFGAAMDVIELDGAGKRKVEDVNSLIESASWSPQELKRKVFTIDECHQLSPVAISSLLKIVEEPPEYLTFIFCTTEPEKIPGTILSRTQKHMFSKISSGNIAGRLRYISDQEGYKAEEGALFSLAKMGRGSMRDSIGFLEQISTAAGEGLITETAVNKYFGVADRKGVYDLVGSMTTGNYSMVMEQCNDMIVASVRIRSLLYEISEVFRSVLMIKIQGEDTRLVDLPDHEIKTLVGLSKHMGLAQLNTLSKEFSTIEKELTYSINKRLVLESTLVRCTARLQQQK